MGDKHDLLGFLYGEFWYADPLREIRSLNDEQLYWVPAPTALPIIWQVGHIAHRERYHFGMFIEGIDRRKVIPDEFDAFGPEWASVADIRASVPATADVLRWVQDVRRRSREVIALLTESDLRRRANNPEPDSILTVEQWLHITAVHTGVHIGRIQLLRALIEGKKERAC